MNKKGFTLTELLAVIAVIGILSLVAIPNIIGIVDNIRKDNMIDDAKKLISLARMEVNSNYDLRYFSDSRCVSSAKTCTLSFSDLNKNKDITKDPDSGNYENASYVKYQINSETSVVQYCIYLLSSKRQIGSPSSCVLESDLFDKDVVVERTS